ncbi:MAG: copper amine oxidase N-terminal domain-containing protein [Clostridiales bacterium]|jgi:hypothetical protein|nr:copper amine oxidase N-terminal domain-containing protein [Clostridiales bacterium]
MGRTTIRWAGSRFRLRAAAAAAAVAIAALAAATPAPGAFAEKGSRAVQIHYQNLKIKLDGRMIIPEDANGKQVYPFLLDDRTYVPVRALAGALGYSVSWDAASATARLTKGGGKPRYGAPGARQSSEAAVVEYADVSIVIDGKKAELDSEPFIYGGTTYLPLRDIAGALGCSVGYEHATRTISIGSPQAGAPTSPLPTPSPAPAATPSPQAKPAAAPAGSFSAADLSFVIAGRSVGLDEDVAAVLQLLGGGYGYLAAPSCAYVGEDKLYSYEGIDISTLPIGGDMICAIDVASGGSTTSKSIGIGSSLGDIEAAYGKDYTQDAGILVYWDGEKSNPKTPQLYFEMGASGTVTAFGMFNGKSYG